MTREDWLIKAADTLIAYSGLSLDFPPYLVAVGYPPGGRRNRMLGCTLQPKRPKKEDGTYKVAHVFINPEIAPEDGLIAYTTMIHELAHVASKDACKRSKGHGPSFQLSAALFGLLPPWETTPVHIVQVDSLYQSHIEQFGIYPHTAIAVKPVEKGRMRAWKCSGEKCIDSNTGKSRNVRVHTTTSRELHVWCADCKSWFMPEGKAAQ